ncbi:hypothetical protein SAMN04489812_3311 [Microlunatus soli]|uniref:Uncharacterized protein n=1 Tax=Microlunatus soli TaxID=630515 RepID=A0A1H1VRI8_9ACTN|nr:hypothetical protein SAMN04489812_3311 [Microlunatus soli]
MRPLGRRQCRCRHPAGSPDPTVSAPRRRPAVDPCAQGGNPCQSHSHAAASHDPTAPLRRHRRDRHLLLCHRFPGHLPTVAPLRLPGSRRPRLRSAVLRSRRPHPRVLSQLVPGDRRRHRADMGTARSRLAPPVRPATGLRLPANHPSTSQEERRRAQWFQPGRPSRELDPVLPGEASPSRRVQQSRAARRAVWAMRCRTRSSSQTAKATTPRPPRSSAAH